MSTIRFTTRSIRSAGLVGRRDPGAGPVRMSRACVSVVAPSSAAGAGCVAVSRRAAKASRTVQSPGCTDSSTWSKTANPTGLVSMRRSTGGPARRGGASPVRLGISVVSHWVALSRRNTMTSYWDV